MKRVASHELLLLGNKDFTVNETQSAPMLFLKSNNVENQTNSRFL